jgi:hypothetical protein
MKVHYALLQKMTLAGVLLLSVLRSVQAGAYLVCYLPPDTEKRFLRYCPGTADAVAGDPCQCLLKTGSIAGRITVFDIPDTAVEAGKQIMCVPRIETAAKMRLCSSFHSTGDVGCECDGAIGGEVGEQYSVSAIPRVGPLRTNQTAASDFLRRLQECCVSK